MKYPIEWRNPKTKKSSSHKNTSTLLSSIIWIAVFACVLKQYSHVFTSSSPGPNSQQMKLLVISFLPVQNVEFCNFSLQSPFHGWISYVDGRGYEIYAYIYHRNLPTVGEYTISYMDGMGLFWNHGVPSKTAIANRHFLQNREVEGCITPKAADDCVETQETTAVGMIPYMVSWDYKGYTPRVSENKVWGHGAIIKGQWRLLTSDERPYLALVPGRGCRVWGYP